MAEAYYGYQFETGAHCNIEQYEMLKRCSDKSDITEWREWGRSNFNAEIHLQGADFK